MKPHAGTPVTGASHLEKTDGGRRLAFRLLDDWPRTRLRDHHVPLQKRIHGPR